MHLLVCMIVRCQPTTSFTGKNEFLTFARGRFARIISCFTASHASPPDHIFGWIDVTDCEFVEHCMCVTKIQFATKNIYHKMWTNLQLTNYGLFWSCDKFSSSSPTQSTCDLYPCQRGMACLSRGGRTCLRQGGCSDDDQRICGTYTYYKHNSQ